MDGGECGPVDCNDADATVKPGAEEVCADSVDNDCDALVDEGCDPACPDADGDSFMDAACGGNDCNDLDAAINPGASEVCGNGVDENCNGTSDDVCTTCPEGGVLSITSDLFKERTLVVTGRSDVRTRICIVDADTGKVLAQNIRVKGGKWKVEIEKLPRGYVPETIKAINTDGCETVMEVTVKVEDREDREDDERDDD